MTPLRRQSFVYYAFVAALLAAGLARAESLPIDVSSGWSFRLGDSPTGPDGLPTWIADETPSTAWRPMTPLSTPAPGAKGFAWLRIELPSGDWRDPTLFVGSVQGGGAEFYTTHRILEVGRIHPEGVEERIGDGWTMIPLQREELGRPIYVRLQQSDQVTGIRRSLRLGNRSDHLSRLLARSIPSLLVTGILLLLALVGLAGFLLRRQDTYLLYCSAFALSATALVFGISEAQNFVIDSPSFWSTTVVVGAFLMVPSLAAFISSAILAEAQRWFALVTRGLFFLGAGFSLVTMADATFTQRHVLLIVVFISGGILLSMIVGVREAFRGNMDAQIFSVGVALFFLSILFDSLSVLGYVPTDGYHNYLGLLAVTMSLGLVVVRRLMLMQRSLEEHSRAAESRYVIMNRLSSRLADSAGVLLDTVARLRQSSDVQNAVVDQQAGTLQEILATAQEINQASRIAAEKATAIMGSAAQADEANQSVGHAVEEGLGGIATMGSEVAEMASRIRALEQHTRQIAGIVETVKDLADQSNMLALNAAIEAVRSGEAGKGFVVVAREMRSLADLSLQATGRIREVLVNVNEGIREAASLSERSEGRIQQSLRQLQGSGEQLRSLSQIVRDSNSNVRQISAAIGQQSAGVSQVFAALNDLSRQMTDTVERLKETREAAASVEQVAEAMSMALSESGAASATPATPRPAAQAA